MRGWILLACLVAMPVRAADENVEMAAVSKAWDRYALASSEKKPEAAAMLSNGSQEHLVFLRDAALYASKDQIRRLPIPDRAIAYVMRASKPADALKALDRAGVARLAIESGWYGVAEPAEGRSLTTLTHVTLLDDDEAIGEIGPPTGTQYRFGPTLVREDGAWRVRSESLTADENLAIQQQARNLGWSEQQMLEFLVARFLGDEQPSPGLIALETPLLDDAAQRTRLNERWPDYDAAYAARIRALERKAESDDPLAQFALGSLKAYASLPNLVPKDEDAGWKLIEKASDGGNAQASYLAFAHFISDRKDYTPERLQRATIHLKRAAEAAVAPEAMSALGGFYFEGAGGLPRDCRQAAAWQARAEEAGYDKARNEQVWTWATCPIASQRDPARAMELAGYMIQTQDKLSASELDTVAAAYAANGKFAEAIDFQQRAIDKVATSSEIPDKTAAAATRKRMQARLKGYRAGRDYVQDYNTFEEIMAGRY